MVMAVLFTVFSHMDVGMVVMLARRHKKCAESAKYMNDCGKKSAVTASMEGQPSILTPATQLLWKRL
jgi:hypothetical protein